MKYIITAIVTICLTAGSMAQGINYRIGGILGEDKPYMVVGVNLFELAPNSDMWAETVAFTSFDVNEAWGGFGIRKDWKQGTYTVSGAISVVNRVDQSINFENTRIAASVGVKF